MRFRTYDDLKSTKVCLLRRFYFTKKIRIKRGANEEESIETSSATAIASD